MMNKEDAQSAKTHLQIVQTEFHVYDASPVYAWVTIFIVWLASLLPWRNWDYAPDILILVIVFWSVHEVRGIGFLAALCLGILMDVHDASLFGGHSLTYILIVYGAFKFRRRMIQFGSLSQMLHLLPVFTFAALPSTMLQAWLLQSWPGWSWLLSGFITGLLWIVADLILKLPVRHIHDGDPTLG